MSERVKTQACPTCGARMTFEERDDVASYGGREKRTPTLAWWCSSCSEAIFAGETLLAGERAYRELKAAADSSPEPSG